MRTVKVQPPTEVRLTPREREVCELLASGMSNKEIATQMGVSIAAVKRHLERLFSKLSVNSRAGLAVAFWNSRGGHLASGRTAIYSKDREKRIVTSL